MEYLVDTIDVENGESVRFKDSEFEVLQNLETPQDENESTSNKLIKRRD